MRKNVYKLAALTMFAALSLSACKKHEAVDLTGIHTSAAETMAETDAGKDAAKETKASETSKEETKTESQKEEATAASKEESSKTSNASEALSVKAKIATEKNGKVSIEYPILSNLRDDSMTQTVNDLFKEKATQILSDWEIDPQKDEVNVECSQISLDKDKAVFVFRGDVNADGSAHPASLWYAISVNLNKGTLIGLNDYADPASIAAYLASGDVTVVDSDDEEYVGYVKDFLQLSDEQTWKGILEYCDFTLSEEGVFPEAFSYEKDGDIYLITPVSHALGDYALIKYSPDTK